MSENFTIGQQVYLLAHGTDEQEGTIVDVGCIFIRVKTPNGNCSCFAKSGDVFLTESTENVDDRRILFRSEEDLNRWKKEMSKMPAILLATMGMK